MLTLARLHQDLVSFVVNAPYSTIVENLSQASIGISTMVDEHFGINVVEFMVGSMHALAFASLTRSVIFTGSRPHYTLARLGGALARHCR